MTRRLRVLLPLLAGTGVVVLIYAGRDLLPWRSDAILAHRDALRAAVEAAPIRSLLLFTALYVAIISSALPVGPPMSLIAGFLFGRWVGTGAIVLAATAGALVVFAVARRSARSRLGKRLRARAGPIYDTVAADLRANAFGYLLVMRLVPFFPFFLVNIVAGLFGVPARTFALATLIGRLPAAFLYVSLGEEVGRIASVSELATLRIAAILTGMGLLALLPVVIAHRRRRLAKAGRRSACTPAGPEPSSPER